MFLQEWSDTSLGFMGWGGQSLTKAYTTIIKENTTNTYGVFFGDNLAYIIKNPNLKFFEDIRNKDMKDVASFSIYTKSSVTCA